MEIPLPDPVVDVRDILPEVGFEQTWDGITEKPPLYRYRRGGIDVHVSQVTGEYLRPEFLICGSARNANSLRYIEQSLPLFVESREQLLAWLAFAVGPDFVSLTVVPWFEQGKQLRDHLPWVQHLRKYQEARDARPHCEVPREWMGPLRTRLRTAAEAAGPGDKYTLRFDGSMLVFRLPAISMAVPATGPRPWEHEIEGELRNLLALPKRLKDESVPVGVWEDYLEVGRWRIPLGPMRSGEASRGIFDSPAAQESGESDSKAAIRPGDPTEPIDDARAPTGTATQAAPGPVDAAMLQDGLTLAGWHIENGARTFAAYSKAMLDDLGETVRPFLRSFYFAVRHYPGFNTEGMDTEDSVQRSEPSTAEGVPRHRDAAGLPWAQMKATGTVFCSKELARLGVVLSAPPTTSAPDAQPAAAPGPPAAGA